MSKWLKCTCGGHDSYVQKTGLGLVVGTGFTAEIDLVVPAATLNTIFTNLGPGSGLAEWLYLATASDHDGITAFDTTGTPTWQFTAEQFGGPAAGTLTGDVVLHLKYAAVWNSGSGQSDITVSLNGTPIFTYSTTAFLTASTITTLRVGGFASDHQAGEIYYVDNVVVKDGSGATVFSDDFESGGFSAWTATFGTVAIVDFTPVGPTNDFTLTATPSTVTFPRPGAQTSEITVGLVTAAETVNLTLDTSSFPAGLTGSLDVATGTTPYVATLTVVAAAGLACTSHTCIVTGNDGTNTHTVTVTVVIDGTDGVYDTITASPARAGSTMSQTGADADEGDLIVYNGDLYWVWTEEGAGAGPYLAVWSGSAWTIVASDTVFEDPIADAGFIRTRPRLATDGTYLYLAYLSERNASIDDCRHPGSPLSITPFFAHVWRWDGATWTHLGDLGTGAVINSGSYGDEFSAGDFASDALEISASPDEVGACYVAFFEEGYEGPDAAIYWASRHLTVAGFGVSTLGTVSFDSLLFQPDRPISGGICTTSTNFAPQIFSMKLSRSDGRFTMYVQELAFDPLTDPWWTIIQVWQPAGFLPDITLATDFPGSAPSLLGYSVPLAVSNDVGGHRWAAVARNAFSDASIVRETFIDDPGTFGPTWGIADGSADETAVIDHLVRESNDLWGIRMRTGLVELLTARCSVTSWQSPGASFGGGNAPYSGNPVVFDDAIWAATTIGLPAVYRLPICRDCGTCCSLAAALPIFRNVFKAGDATAPAAPAAGDASPVFDPSFHFKAGAADSPAPPSAGAATPSFSATPFKG